MSIVNVRLAVVSTTILLVAAGAVTAETNLAIGRPYRWCSAPNYGLTTDAADKTQLTDGRIYEGGEALWLAKSTVGWSRRRGVSVTIDLGKVRAIGGLSYRSAAGPSSAVSLPAFIHIWVSDDGKTYHHGGELISASWPGGLPDDAGRPGLLRGQPNGVHRYRAEGLRLRGRYVKLTAYPGAGYLFCDEIEVFGGSFAPRHVKRGKTRLSDGFKRWARDNKYDAIARIRMLYDIQELTRHPRAAAFRDRITRLRRQVQAMAPVAKLDMSRGLPYTPLHAKIWALNGPIQLAAGKNAFSLWQGPCYSPLHPFDPPPAKAVAGELHLMGDEYRTTAINVSNFGGQEAMDAEVGLTWKAASWPTGAVGLRMVRFTESQDRAILAAALPKARPAGENRWFVHLPAGVTSQLWMTFDSSGVGRGAYPAAVTVRSRDGALSAEMDLNVHVHAGRMGRPPVLESWTWDYLHLPGRRLITRENISQARTLLREFLCESFWAGPAHLPQCGRQAPDGTVQSLSNLERFDRWVKSLGRARRYFLYLDTPSNTHRFIGKVKPGTPAYATAVRSYFNALAAHIRSRGLETKRFAFLVQDEPSGGRHEAITAGFIRLAKSAQPEFVFYEDPMYSKLSDVHRPLMEATDMIGPKFYTLNDTAQREYYQKVVKTGGKLFAGYSCTDGGWLRSPVGYFRGRAWLARKYGMTGIGVWSYMASNEASTWDDFHGTAAYEMVFATAKSVTASKHLAAWRDGIEDYEYFHVLDSLLRRARKAGCPKHLLAKAEALLERLPAEALSDIPGKWTRGHGRNDPNEAFDHARLRVLQMIDQVTDGLAAAP